MTARPAASGDERPARELGRAYPSMGEAVAAAMDGNARRSQVEDSDQP